MKCDLVVALEALELVLFESTSLVFRGQALEPCFLRHDFAILCFATAVCQIMTRRRRDIEFLESDENPQPGSPPAKSN
jgi:hypothetical protein